MGVKKAVQGWSNVRFLLGVCILLLCSGASYPSTIPDGLIRGRVIDRYSGRPLAGAHITLREVDIGTSAAIDGRFELPPVSPGTYTLIASMVGYESAQIDDIVVAEDAMVSILIEMDQEAVQLMELTVTPGQFSIMGDLPAARQTLTRENLQTVPFGDDVYRAFTRLPSISAGDYSARFTLRGGANEEILVLMDGMELYEPFHLKDIAGGVLSIIDVTAVEGINLFTGGFSAEYGNRLSGVLNIKSKEITADTRQVSLGLTLMNARVFSQGTFEKNKGSWLISARRGYLDLVLDLMNETTSPRPTYYDVLSKVAYRIDAKHTLSAHLLHAGDRLDFVEDDDNEAFTTYGNSYGWLTLQSVLDPRLFVRTIASVGRLTNTREGIGDDGTENRTYALDEDRRVGFVGFKQDWDLDLSNRWAFMWGIDVRGLTARYDYLSTHRYYESAMEDGSTVHFNKTATHLKPAGHQFAAYLTTRFRLLRPLTAEVGLRYDNIGYTNERLTSPRFNLVWAVGQRTFLRAGWGHFYQSEGIHEIKVTDGENRFYPAERAQHWVAGLEHVFRNGLDIRLEGYFKGLSHLRSDYYNWSNAIEVYPEMRYDRYRLMRNGATSKGLEAYLKYDRGGKFTWWAAYALAYTNEDTGIWYDGEASVGGIEAAPGKFDQRHSIYLDVNYRPGSEWHINGSWQYRSGWPFTERSLRENQAAGGSYDYWLYGAYNGAYFPDYHRLDMWIYRHFSTRRGRISVFLGLINVYNRANVRNIEYTAESTDQQAPTQLKTEEEYWFKFLPSLGLSWSIDL